MWGGQTLVGQMQPGAAYPPNWLLFLLPLRDGHIQPAGLHGYFILTHFFAALACFWLCRDLGRTVAASIFAGFAFAVGGLVGSIEWPQMLNGAVWIPLCVLFYFRSVRGEGRIANAAFAGTFLGFSFLSGHHQIPIFTGLRMAALCLVELWRARAQWRGVFPQIGVFVLFTALVSSLQILPAFEYGTRSIRFEGSENGVFWGQYVPDIVHQQYSLAPMDLAGLLVSRGRPYTFMGITAVTLALIGFRLRFDDRAVRLLGGASMGALLFALGGFSVFHGVAYLLIPMVEKASSPGMAVVIAQFALAVLASYGIDGLRQRPPSRWVIAALVAIGLLPWPALLILSSIGQEAARNYGQVAVAALAALGLAAVLHGWNTKQISERAAVALLSITALFELGTVTGQGFRHRETPGGYLHVLERDADVITFLKKQSDFVRLEVDTDAVPYNVGDWDGIDQFGAYLGGMTSNLVAFEIERLKGRPSCEQSFWPQLRRRQQGLSGRADRSLSWRLGAERLPKPGCASPAVDCPSAPRDRGPRPRIPAGIVDLKREVLLKGQPPALDDCSGADNVALLGRDHTRITIKAEMACKGLLVHNQTFYPGWEALVDGRPAAIEEADGALQSVVVEAGTHRVDFRYRPLTVYWGGLLTAAGLGAALLLAVMRRRPAAGPMGRTASSAPGPLAAF